jgi:hypothetical protein
MDNISRCAELEQRFPGLIRAIVTAYTIQSAGEARGKAHTGSGIKDCVTSSFR